MSALFLFLFFWGEMVLALLAQRLGQLVQLGIFS
jgi:hypothetical protein